MSGTVTYCHYQVLYCEHNNTFSSFAWLTAQWDCLYQLYRKHKRSVVHDVRTLTLSLGITAWIENVPNKFICFMFGPQLVVLFGELLETLEGGGPSLRVGQWGDCISNLFSFLCFLSVKRWEPPLPHTWAAVTSGLDSCSRTSRVWSESKHVFPWARLLMLSILSLQCNRNGYMSHGVF